MELLQRATRGDLDGVKTLIQQGVCVNTKNRSNQTALYFACENKHTDVVQYLLDSGASVNLGEKPLITAVRNHNRECVKLLLEHHATVRCTNTKRESPMSVAVQNRNYPIILLLLQYGAIPPASLGNVAFQLLKHAKAEHATAIHKLIAENYINLTEENVFLAAFSFAFKRGSVELAERMLSNDSFSKIDQLYPDAVYYGAKNNWPTILSKMFDKGVNVNALTDGETPLYVACEAGHQTVVMLLLDNGADPNVKNERRFTVRRDDIFPLQAAVRRGDAVICNMLLQKGAKLDQPGEPLLHAACSIAASELKANETAETRSADQKLSTVRLLLQQGLNVNAVSNEGDTALYRACRSQQLELVQTLLDAGADVSLTSNRCYPLIAACDAGNVELINLLLSAGADAKCSNSSNETCLHAIINAYSSTINLQKLAVCDSKVNIVNIMKSLMDAGADVNVCSSQEETALYRASKAGHEDIVRILLDTGAETNGSSRRHPLYAACKGGYTEIVDLLLQHGADSNASSTSSQPSFILAAILAEPVTCSSSLPICCAVQKGYTKIVELLLKHGADVNKKDQLGKSALIYVDELLSPQRCKPKVLNRPLEEMDFNILKSLLLAGGDVTVSSGDGGLSPLHIASSAGMCDLMMELIERGANCNQLTSGGVSALDLACSNGQESALELLLKNGAKPDQQTGSTRSAHIVHSSFKSHLMPPLCMAARNNSETMVKMLLKHGANANASSKKGDTAVHLATSTAVIETLLNAKANVNATNNNGETPLSVLCEKQQADANVVELLLKFGADPDIHYPLHAACNNNDTDIVKLLLAYGADANSVKMSEHVVFIPVGLFRNALRKQVEPSPLCTACRNGNVAVVSCLLESGANASFTDSQGNTALHFAVERLPERLGQEAKSEEYDPIVTLLLQHDAPVNVISSKGETPLYVACTKGIAGVTKQLLDCRADIGLTARNSDKYPLLIACERKFGDVALMLLDRGADANVSEGYETPLKLASANGDSELVKQLLRCGADVNQMHDISDTALHVAVVHARKCIGNKAFVDIVQMLLKSSAEPNALNDESETPLFLACRSTGPGRGDDVNLDTVQALLEHGADPNADPLPYDFDIDYVISPLLDASRCGNTDLVILLMKYGARVDQRSGLGRTALHYAIGYDNDSLSSRCESSNSNTSTAEMLVSAGADVNAMDETGASPLYLACERGEIQFAKLLLSRGANPTMKDTDKPPLHAACKVRNCDLVKLLLEYNADVDVPDKHGKTALHCVLESVSHRNSDSHNRSVQDVVQILLDGGADLKVASTDGETPFYVACSKGLTSVVAKMLECGAKVDGVSGKKPPLNVACRNKHVSVVRLLLSNGANPDILEVNENRCGRALPLHIAAADGSSELVELLLKHGSNVDVTDAYGSTALHYVIEHYNPRTTTLRYSHESRATSNAESVVDSSLENRADVNVLNESGGSPLYTAVSRCISDETIMMLIKAGANVNAINCEGKTALCVAIERLTKRDCDLSTGNMMKSTIRLLLEHGADVNVLMPDGRSPLFLVISAIAASQRLAYPGDVIDVLQLLVKHGAILSDCFSHLGQDISRQSHETLKDLATFDGKDEFIVDLFRAGADFQLTALCCYAVATHPGEARSIRLCQAAVLAGYTPSAAELQLLQLIAATEVANGGLLSQLVNWLNEDRQRVPSLLRQCRVVIRRQLSVAVQHRSILTSINKLSLPNTLKMYLQFEGTLTEVDLSVNKQLCNEQTSTENWRQLISPYNSEVGSDVISDVEYDSDGYIVHSRSHDDYWYYDSDDDPYWWKST